jgi:hypothetical protein
MRFELIFRQIVKAAATVPRLTVAVRVLEKLLQEPHGKVFRQRRKRTEAAVRPTRGKPAGSQTGQHRLVGEPVNSSTRRNRLRQPFIGRR